MTNMNLNPYVTRLFLATSILASVSGCSAEPASQSTEEISDESTSAILSLPRREDFAASARARLTGYRLVVNPMGGCLVGSPIDQTRAWTANVTTQIRQGCDYSIGVELGEMEAAGSRLKEAFFSNIGANGLGVVLRAAEFKNKPSISVNIVLGPTEAGRRAGFGDQSVSPPPSNGNTDLSIEVSVDAGPASTTCQSGDTSEGSLSSQDDANSKCPTWCSHKNAQWNRQWNTRSDGTSVCGCVCSQVNGGGTSGDCSRDVTPPSEPRYTCQQQAEWGKCSESWMQGYCNISCGRCGATPGSRVPIVMSYSQCTQALAQKGLCRTDQVNDGKARCLTVTNNSATSFLTCLAGVVGTYRENYTNYTKETVTPIRFNLGNQSADTICDPGNQGGQSFQFRGAREFRAYCHLATAGTPTCDVKRDQESCYQRLIVQ